MPQERVRRDGRIDRVRMVSVRPQVVIVDDGAVSLTDIDRHRLEIEINVRGRPWGLRVHRQLVPQCLVRIHHASSTGTRADAFVTDAERNGANAPA